MDLTSILFILLILLHDLLVRLLSEGPIYIVWLVGLSLAIARWRRHPHVSLLAVIGLSGSLVLSILNNLLIIILPMQLRDSEISAAFAVLGVCNSLVDMVLWGLILAAMFGWRADPE